MATRRGVGVGAVQKHKAMAARLKEKGSELSSEELERLRLQLDSFKIRLEEFASKHRQEIRKNPGFRRHFQEMCASVGVDPLASGKGFWAEKLGVGDFYYELGVQVVEVCLASAHANGGVITLEEIKHRLDRSRSKDEKGKPYLRTTSSEPFKNCLSSILDSLSYLWPQIDTSFSQSPVNSPWTTPESSSSPRRRRPSLSHVSWRKLAGALRERSRRFRDSSKFS